MKLPTDSAFEFLLVQNEALGATLLWNFLRSYVAHSSGSSAPLFLAMLVLPICFHQTSASVIGGCKGPGGLYKALSKDRTLPAGLQSRVEQNADMSFRSLHLACTAKLIRLETHSRHTIELALVRKTKPPEWSPQWPHDKCATNLGRWFAESNTSTILSLLQVRF